VDKESRYQNYTVTADLSAIRLLNRIKGNRRKPGYRMPCAMQAVRCHGRSGRCAWLSKAKTTRALMVFEPLPNFKVLKDLIVDMDSSSNRSPGSLSDFSERYPKREEGSQEERRSGSHRCILRQLHRCLPQTEQTISILALPPVWAFRSISTPEMIRPEPAGTTGYSRRGVGMFEPF
jgi:succinate dehydrogenase/fumarate reductase-like Fe-S protein